METLFQLSRAYFSLRAILARWTGSPFVRAAALIALAVILMRPSAEAPSGEAAPALTAEDRSLLAWAVVAAPITGAGGKGAALETLHGLGERLDGLDLSCARLSGAPGCETGARLVDLDLGGAGGGAPAALSGARLNGAAMDRARLGGAALAGADLSRASLRDADLTGIDAEDAAFFDADLSGAGLARARLVEAELDRARLDGADLTRVVATRARMVETRLVGADLSDADFSGADLARATLQSADLSGARFNLATLTEAEISDADLSGALDLGTAFAEGLWAWSDRPPRNAPDGAPRVALCDPGEDGARRQAHRLAVAARARAPGKPDGC